MNYGNTSNTAWLPWMLGTDLLGEYFNMLVKNMAAKYRSDDRFFTTSFIFSLQKATVVTFPPPDPGGRRGPAAPRGCLSCLGDEAWPYTRQWRPLMGPVHSVIHRTNRLYQQVGVTHVHAFHFQLKLPVQNWRPHQQWVKSFSWPPSVLLIEDAETKNYFHDRSKVSSIKCQKKMKNAHHDFPEHQMRSLNCSFCPAKSLK